MDSNQHRYNPGDFVLLCDDVLAERFMQQRVVRLDERINEPTDDPGWRVLHHEAGILHIHDAWIAGPADPPDWATEQHTCPTCGTVPLSSPDACRFCNGDGYSHGNLIDTAESCLMCGGTGLASAPPPRAEQHLLSENLYYRQGVKARHGDMDAWRRCLAHDTTLAHLTLLVEATAGLEQVNG